MDKAALQRRFLRGKRVEIGEPCLPGGKKMGSRKIERPLNGQAGGNSG